MSDEGSSSRSGSHVPYKTEAFSLFRTLSLESMEKKGLDWSREKKEYAIRERFPVWVERQRRKLEGLGLLKGPVNISEIGSSNLGDLASSSGRVDGVSGDPVTGSSDDIMVGVPDVIHAVPVALAMPYDHASDFERGRRERERVEELMRCQVDAHDLVEMNIKVKTEEEVRENIEDLNRLFRDMDILGIFYLPNSRCDLAAMKELKREVEGAIFEGDQSFMHPGSLG